MLDEVILYIANHLCWKSFAVVEMNCNLLKNICGCMVILCGQIQLHRGNITISLEKFRCYQSILENCETFPPQCTIILLINVQITIYTLPIRKQKGNYESLIQIFIYICGMVLLA